MSAPNEAPLGAQQPDDGATREAASVEQLEYLTTFTRHDWDCRVTREAVCTCGLWAATDGMFAALSQRPRAETPTDDKRDAARWRKVRPFLTTVGEDVAYLSVFEDAPSSHPGATVEDIVDALEEWERPESPAPRVPEAGSAPLPNEDHGVARCARCDARRSDASDDA